MSSPETPNLEPETTPVAPAPRVITTPDFSGVPAPIGQWTEREDFPRCVLGVYVSIHGFAGVVTEIINQSIKLVAPDGVTQRFNAYRLKTLFAPPDRSRPAPMTSIPERPKAIVATRPDDEEVVPVAPERRFVTAPDFKAPVRAIRTYATQPDFPECAYGKHVDIPGYAGVVVEIVRGSLRVKCEAGTVRSYNADALKKLYGRG